MIFSSAQMPYVLYKVSIIFITYWQMNRIIVKNSRNVTTSGFGRSFTGGVVGIVCEVACCAAVGAGSTWGVKRGWEWDLAAASRFRVWGSLARLIDRRSLGSRTWWRTRMELSFKYLIPRLQGTPVLTWRKEGEWSGFIGSWVNLDKFPGLYIGL